MFVRVEMQIGEPKPATFVSEAALNSDQGTSFLWVVPDEQGEKSSGVAKVDRRNVERGPRKKGLIAVTGLKEGDRVVVSGQQTVRKGIEVQITEVPMPTAKAPEGSGPHGSGSQGSASK
jgi:multidrug efflux pump subunit AcrA (membrane-fusion protein)